MMTGRIVKGGVYDCNKKAFLRALTDLDSQLYIKWNPSKQGGVGCWEIRRRPDHKVAVPRWETGNTIVFELQYVEYDIVHHVLDIPYLTFRAIEYLRSIDTYNTKNWVDDYEYRENKEHERALKANREDLRYAVKHYKKAFSDFQDIVKSGGNPADLLKGL